MNEEGEIVPADDTSDPPPAAKKNPAPVPYDRFQQVVQQRRDIELKLNEANAALGNAETAKLAAEKNYADLDTSTKAAFAELETKLNNSNAALDKYKEVISATVSEMTTDWPEEARMFDPGPDADPMTRLEWAQKAKLLVAKLQPGSTGAGIAPKPSPKQPTPETKEVKSSIDVKRRF